MVRINGKSVSGGIAIGKIRFIRRKKTKVNKYSAVDTDGEIKRYKAATDCAKSELYLLEKRQKMRRAKAAQKYLKFIV